MPCHINGGMISKSEEVSTVSSLTTFLNRQLPTVSPMSCHTNEGNFPDILEPLSQPKYDEQTKGLCYFSPVTFQHQKTTFLHDSSELPQFAAGQLPFTNSEVPKFTSSALSERQKTRKDPDLSPINCLINDRLRFDSPPELQQNTAKDCEQDNVIIKRSKTSGKCEAEGCPTSRHFGYDRKTAKFCFQHKKEGMINLSLRKCLECPRTASFGFSHLKLKQYCSEHKKEGCINLSHKTCKTENCDKSANYGYFGKPLLFCKEHKMQGMELRRTWKKVQLGLRDRNY